MRILIPLLLAASVVQADDGCRRALSFVDLALSSDRSAIRSALYGDFNEDGRPDVFLQMNDNSSAIALNRGSVFESMPAESLGANPPGAVAVADVNGDGHLDLLYLQRVFGGDSLGVAYGRGDGTFQPPVMHTVSLPDYDVGGVVDFDRDRVPDYVRTSLLRTGSVTFVHGKRDGTYETAPTFTFSTPVFPPIKIVAGDFDGDGNIDVVRFGTNSLAISDLVFGWNDGT